MRELENIVERLIACASGRGPVSAPEAQACLPRWVPELANASQPVPADRPGVGARVSPRAISDEVLRQTLADCGGDRAQAAARLGISRTTLWRRLRAGE